MEKCINISIIGIGNIGRALLLNLLNEKNFYFLINIIDLPENAEGTLLDFHHALEFRPNHSIVFNSKDHFHESSYIFHCAGVGIQQGSSRLSTTDENIKITHSIFEHYQPNDKAKIIVITNPVDIITFYTWKYSNLPLIKCSEREHIWMQLVSIITYVSVWVMIEI